MKIHLGICYFYKQQGESNLMFVKTTTFSKKKVHFPCGKNLRMNNTQKKLRQAAICKYKRICLQVHVDDMKYL
jgi:hypothetical protein